MHFSAQERAHGNRIDLMKESFYINDKLIFHTVIDSMQKFKPINMDKTALYLPDIKAIPKL